ncbi:MAG TPA: hypothetical protein DDW87_03545, partial [Firmicutes bacterium]|nr:hypothetical protein [Bacillota bacterium]
HPVYVAGLFDLLQFRVAQDDMHVYFDFQFAALTNPFQAPEGYFHQRLEVYIETGNKMGCTEMQIGPHRLQTNPDWGWSYRLSVAPFGESRLYVVDGQSVQAFSEGVGSQSLSASQTIRVQVPRELLPHPDPAWGYYVLVGSFDGLARDFWRDLGEGPWQVGGSGVP